MWRDLRDRTHLTLEWAFLTGRRGELVEHFDGSRSVRLDARLSRRERRAVLAHELVHDERGILFDDSTPATMVAKEECLVQAETLRRLVPPAELDRLVRARVVDEGTVTWRDVVEWFDVPRAEAEEALRSLRGVAVRRHPASGRTQF